MWGTWNILNFRTVWYYSYFYWIDVPPNLCRRIDMAMWAQMKGCLRRKYGTVIQKRNQIQCSKYILSLSKCSRKWTFFIYFYEKYFLDIMSYKRKALYLGENYMIFWHTIFASAMNKSSYVHCYTQNFRLLLVFLKLSSCPFVNDCT